jgi:hypothetical protein
MAKPLETGVMSLIFPPPVLAPRRDSQVTSRIRKKGSLSRTHTAQGVPFVERFLAGLR